MDLLTLLFLGLATWRVSTALVNEIGPFGAFSRFRHAAGVRWNKETGFYGTNVVGELLLCIWCTSFWVAMVWIGFLMLSAKLAVLLASPFAVSAVAILVNKVADG